MLLEVFLICADGNSNLGDQRQKFGRFFGHADLGETPDTVETGVDAAFL